MNSQLYWSHHSLNEKPVINVKFSILCNDSASRCHLTDKVIGVLAEGMKYADLKKLE